MRKAHRGSGKISFKHDLIHGLRELLETIAPWEEIQSIFPARIKPTGTTRPVQLSVQYRQDSGVKCLAKGKGAVQEVFFIGPDPEALERRLRQYCREAN